MRCPLILFLLLATFSALGQGASTGIKPGRGCPRFSFGLTASPDLGYRLLNNNKGDSITGKLINIRNEYEIPVFAFSAGINARAGLLPFLALETGIRYSQYGYKMTGITVTNQVGEVIPGADATSITRFHYIAVPLSCVLSYGRERWRVLADAGLEFSYLLHENTLVSITYPDSTDRINLSWEYPFKRFNLFPFAGVACEYHFNKWLLSAGPVFRFGVINLSDTPVRTFLWSAGFRFGVYYHL